MTRSVPSFRRLVGLLVLGLARASVVLAIASILWVALYRFVDPPTSMNILLARVEGVEIDRRPARLANISPRLVRAVIAAEDASFCRHRGFDLAEIRAAIAEARQGDRLRGASTITQQAAKNAFLWNGGGFARKAAEAWFAGLVDLLWGKRRTMEIYLNLAEWGTGIYGAEAAAQQHYGVAAEDLNQRQAARLAAVLPSPRRYRLEPPSRYVHARAERIASGARDVADLRLDDCVLAR